MKKFEELNKLPVTKHDAARRQLETAITLWFHEADPVSIHTLVAAAYRLLYDLSTKAGGTPPMMPNSPNIRPQFLGEWRQILNRAQNFFKHADKDPTDTLLFAPRLTQAMMLEACECYQMLAHERRPLMQLFTIWHSLHEPHLFLPPKQKLGDLGSVDELTQLSKPQFFHFVLPAMSTIENA